MSLRTMTWNESVLAIAIGMAIWSMGEVAIMVRRALWAISSFSLEFMLCVRRYCIR